MGSLNWLTPFSQTRLPFGQHHATNQSKNRLLLGLLNFVALGLHPFAMLQRLVDAGLTYLNLL